MQKELGQFEFWFNFWSQLEIFAKILSFVILAIKVLPDINKFLKKIFNEHDA